MKYSYWLLILILCCCSPFAAYGLEVPKLQGYVNDYAGMISPPAKLKIEEALKAFDQSDSTQIVILTVPSLEGETVEEFATKVGEAWKIGKKGKDNGVLFIVSKQERKIRIEVGYGLEGRLTDLTAGRIIDLVIKPRFKQEDYDGGFIAGVSSLIDATRGEFRGEPRSARRGKRSISPFLSILLFFGIFTLMMGSASRVLGGVIGAVGLPSLTYLFGSVASIPILILLLVLGFGGGFLLPSLFSSASSRRGVHPDQRDGGFFYGPGTGGFYSRRHDEDEGHSGGGSFGGGGGGSFGGGGASGDW